MTDAPQGLRARKRQRTRDALLIAAAAVFREHGYDAATVEQIAERAGVSTRTFFRYFDGKDAVALAWTGDFYAAWVAALAARANDEAALIALTASAGDAWSSLGEPETFARMIALVGDSPALLAALLRRVDAAEREIVNAVAGREHKPADDLDTRLVVAAVNAALRVAVELWLQNGTPLEKTFERCLWRLRRGLGAQPA